MLNRTSTLLLPLGLQLLVGCVVDPCRQGDSLPNGNQGNLRFQIPPNPAQGLLTTVVLPSGMPWIEDSIALYTRSPDSCFDFRNASVEVDLGSGFTDANVVSRRERNPEVYGSLSVSFRCDAPADMPHEVRVRIRAGETIRYDDSFDITCRPVTQLELQTTITDPYRSLVGKRYIEGGQVWVDSQASASDGTVLSGFGLRSVGRPALLSALPSQDGDAFYSAEIDRFLVVAAGENPLLAAGNVSAILPIEIVPASAWKLDLSLTDIEEDRVTADAWPLLIGDDSRLDGLQPCAWSVGRKGTYESLDSNESCSLRYHLSSFDPPDEICVNAAGQRACQPLVTVSASRNG